MRKSGVFYNVSLPLLGCEVESLVDDIVNARMKSRNHAILSREDIREIKSQKAHRT